MPVLPFLSVDPSLSVRSSGTFLSQDNTTHRNCHSSLTCFLTSGYTHDALCLVTYFVTSDYTHYSLNFTFLSVFFLIFIFLHHFTYMCIMCYYTHYVFNFTFLPIFSHQVIHITFLIFPSYLFSQIRLYTLLS